jgi:hypothetical protein
MDISWFCAIGDIDFVQNVQVVQSFDRRFALLRMTGIESPFPRVSPQGYIEGRSVQIVRNLFCLHSIPGL